MMSGYLLSRVHQRYMYYVLYIIPIHIHNNFGCLLMYKEETTVKFIT